MAPKPLSKLANKATRQSPPGLDGTPATHTVQPLLLLLSRLPSGCEPPIPATNNPSKTREGSPLPAPHQSRTRAGAAAAAESSPARSRKALRPGAVCRGACQPVGSPWTPSSNRLLRLFPRVLSASHQGARGLRVGVVFLGSCLTVTAPPQLVRFGKTTPSFL